MGNYLNQDYVKQVVRYYVDNKSTIRATARYFGISKSTVYKYCAVYIGDIDRVLALQSWELLDINKEERCIRGGKTTSEKSKNEIKKMVYDKFKELGITNENTDY